MKYIKLFEEWSPNFNRTLQGASVIATSTNKGFGKAAKSIEDYANRSISKEEFKVQNDNLEVIIIHDPKFILSPVKWFKECNSDRTSGDSYGNYFHIPVITKSVSNNNFTGESMITFCKDYQGVSEIKIHSRDKKICDDAVHNKMGKFQTVRFSDRNGIENFFAMIIQTILSSPEPGTPAESASQKLKNRMNKIVDSDMTKEKQQIIDVIQNSVLSRDMREFTM